MATADKNRYLYRRERADGKANDTTCQRSFEKWLKEYQPGDRFYVAQCRWIECERDGTVPFGKELLMKVKKVTDVTPVEN